MHRSNTAPASVTVLPRAGFLRPRRGGAVPIGLFLVAALVAGLLVAARSGPGLVVQESVSPTAYVPERILVKFDHDVSRKDRARARRDVGAEVVGSLRGLRVQVLEVPRGREASAVAELSRNKHVVYAERDQAAEPLDVTPNDPWWPNEWPLVRVQAPKAWASTQGSASTIIAVLDTGVDASQPDLNGAFIPGWNTLAGSTNTNDTDGHGTLVAGVAVARSNNGMGVTSYCWECSLMPVKVIDTGAGTISSVSAGITWAADHNARVISLSLGFSSSSTTLQNAVKYAHSRNAVIVAAAGNYGTTSPVYPASYAEVLGVAGTDGNDKLYSWSSYGSTVKLAAPGCNYTTGAGSWYGPFCGTSSAAPALAGIAGLLVSYAPTATNTAIENALTSSAVPIGSVVQYGRADAYRALAALGGGTTEVAPSNTALPTITGKAQEGAALTASDGTWSGSPTSYTYAWQRCDSSGGCVHVTGAAASTYDVVAADIGSTLRVAVTAANSVGSYTATSDATAVVGAIQETATSKTTTFTGTLNKKRASQTFSLTVGTGHVSAALAFVRSPNMSVAVTGNDGVIGTASGPSVVRLVQSLAAGSYQFTVTGSGGTDSFTLTITSPVA